MEVAEVCWGGAGGDTMACGREPTPKRKASHRGHRGHGGGGRLSLKFVGRCWRGYHGLRARTNAEKKSIAQSHRGHGGGWRLSLKLLAVTPWAAGENERRKEHIAQRS
jgi:hypothetical protein